MSDVLWLTVYTSVVFIGMIIAMIFALLYSTYSKPIPRSKHECVYVDPNEEKGSDVKQFPLAGLTVSPHIKLSLIVPAYNEEKRLPIMLDATIDLLERRSKSDPSAYSYEIIIVDDGSSDTTTRVALEYSKRFTTDKVRVLTLDINRGKGGAVRMGVLVARGEYILFLDADGATDIKDISKMENEMSKIEKDGLGVVIGSRAHLEKESVAQRTLLRTILMFGFHMLVSVVGGVSNVRDTQCGFKLFSRNAARLCFENMHLERWCFDVEIIFILQRLCIPLAETPVNWHEVAGSKLQIIDSTLQMGKDLLMIRLCYLLGIWRLEHRKEKVY